LSEDIVSALQSEDPEDRRIAAGRLAEVSMGRPELVIVALGDEDWRVREEACEVARSLAPDPDLLVALVDALDCADNVGLRNAAVDALGAYGEAAVDALSHVMGTLDADGRKLAVEALAATRQPSALFVLRSALDDEDPNVRAAGLEAAASLGTVSPDEVLAILSARLDDPDPFLRLVALNGLNQLGVALPWSRLEPLLTHPLLRRAALEAAGNSGSTQAAPHLVAALSENGTDMATSDWPVALEAAVALAEYAGAPRLELARLLSAAPESTQARLFALAEPGDDLAMRRAAVRLLGLIGTTEAARVAVSVLSDEQVLEEAQVALCELGSVATNVLIDAVRQQEGDERAAAVELLGRVASELDVAAKREAASALYEVLDDDSPEVVRAALDALGDVGGAEGLCNVARTLSGSVDPFWQRSAENALSALGSRYPEDARRVCEDARTGRYPALVLARVLAHAAQRSGDASVIDNYLGRLHAGLSDAAAAVRRVALEGIGVIGDARSGEVVAFTLTDEEPVVRVTAVQTLGKLRSPEGVAVGADALLAIVMSGRDGELMAAAAAALGRIGDARTLEALSSLVSGADARVAVAAVEAIAQVPGVRRLDALLPGLEHPSAEVVKATLRAIAGEREPRVLIHVGRFLDHEAWDIRRQAADVLGRLGGEAEIQLLRAKLDTEREPLVRDALERALEELGALRRTPMPPQPGSYRTR
jgi:HEAT repeat protein